MRTPTCPATRKLQFPLMVKSHSYPPTVFSFLKTRSYVSQIALELAMWTRMTLNSCSSCLCYSGARIVVVSFRGCDENTLTKGNFIWLTCPGHSTQSHGKKSKQEPWRNVYMLAGSCSAASSLIQPGITCIGNGSPHGGLDHPIEIITCPQTILIKMTCSTENIFFRSLDCVKLTVYAN